MLALFVVAALRFVVAFVVAAARVVFVAVAAGSVGAADCTAVDATAGGRVEGVVAAYARVVRPPPTMSIDKSAARGTIECARADREDRGGVWRECSIAFSGWSWPRRGTRASARASRMDPEHPLKLDLVQRNAPVPADLVAQVKMTLCAFSAVVPCAVFLQKFPGVEPR